MLETEKITLCYTTMNFAIGHDVIVHTIKLCLFSFQVV